MGGRGGSSGSRQRPGSRAEGATFIGFERNVLPADFFCTGSKPFAGKIAFKGVPIATFPQGALGSSDTIVQRLEEAVFDENGVAVTRLQIRAVQFEAVQPFRNECGEFQVRVGLHGEQPITEMRIVRESPNGGLFEAEVAVHAKIVFTPTDHAGEILELTREVRFPPRRNSYWAHKPGSGGGVAAGFVVIDTDFDGQPDTFVPGTSRNFAAGWPPEPLDKGPFRQVQDPSQTESPGLCSTVWTPLGSFPGEGSPTRWARRSYVRTNASANRSAAITV